MHHGGEPTGAGAVGEILTLLSGWGRDVRDAPAADGLLER